jgi:hypothetical protein
MVTSSSGASNFPACSNANTIVNISSMFTGYWSTDLSTGYAALKALEDEF